jgi:hypothetical protein
MIQNISLLMRWVWKFQVKDNSLWSQTINTYYGSNPFDAVGISFFLQDIRRLLPIHGVSTICSQDGTLLWRWEPNNAYSAKFTYSLLINPGVRPLIYKTLWIDCSDSGESPPIPLATHQG